MLASLTYSTMGRLGAADGWRVGLLCKMKYM